MRESRRLGQSIPTNISTERDSDVAPSPDRVLSAPSTTDDTTMDTIQTTDGTTIEDSRTQFEDPRDDRE